MKAEGQPNRDGYFDQLSNGSYVGGFEQHTELNKWIGYGMQLLHGRKVDVAQDLRITLDRDGQLNAYIMHGTFPSVELSVNGEEAYDFWQHSFLLSHSETTNPSDVRFSLDAVLAGKRAQSTSDKMNLQYREIQAPFVKFAGFISEPKNPKTYSSIPW